MKKLLIVLMVLFLSIGAMAQDIWIDYSKVKNLPVYIMDADTSITIDVSEARYFIDSQYIWDSFDATDGYVRLQTSSTMTGENFVNFSPIDSLAFDAASGNKKLINWSYPTNCKRIRFFIESGANSVGNLYIYIILTRQRER